MADRPELPRGPQAHVSLIGWLIEQPIAHYSSIRKEPVVQAEIKLKDDAVPIKAFGEIATRLAEIASGTGLQIEGNLKVYRRGLRKQAFFFDVEVETIDILAIPQHGVLR